jgi:predicted methyltransferase
MVVDADDMPFVNDIDMAFWGFNLHDIYNESGEEAALIFLAGIERALKPGGVLAISDHVGEAGNDNAKLHRIEPEIMKDLLRKAGFTIEATSDFLANPKDDHTRSIYDDDLRYMTDRILIRARKAQ